MLAATTRHMMTLKAGVEQAIKKVLPEVKEVVDIEQNGELNDSRNS